MKLKLKRQYSFHVPASGSGVSDEGWRDAGARHIAYWQLAKSQLNEFNFLFRGMKISVVIDWSPVIRSFERYYRLMGAIEEYQKTHSGPWFDKISEQFQQRHTKINCLVTVECQNADDARFPSTFLENVLYNVFLIMNLADPGSCEFYNSMIRAIGEATSPGERRPSELFHFRRLISILPY